MRVHALCWVHSRRSCGLLVLRSAPAAVHATAAITLLGTPLYAGEGDTVTYRIVLTEAPTQDVTVLITPDSGLDANTTSVSFTQFSWNVPLAVDVTATDDAADRGESYVLSLTHQAVSFDARYSSPDAAFAPVSGNVTVTVFDNDVACRRPCSAGEHSTVCNGEDVCQPCPAGRWCSGSCDEPTLCAAGTANPATGSSVAGACAACSDGYYAAAQGAAECTVCTAGHQCADAAALPVACPPGSSAPQGQLACTPCADGTYANFTGASSCHACPAGHACPVPSQAARACDLGTYAPAGNGTCLPCPSGFACPDPAAAPVACADGTYSLAGWGTCVSCPPGYACPNRYAVPEICAAGTWSRGGVTACSASEASARL